MDDMSTPTLAEIRAALDAATPGKWEWKGKLSPDWMPDSLNAFDDLRVEIPTPDKVYDADLYYVLQAMKSGFVMLRNADAELIANAPDYIRALLEVVEAANRIAVLIESGGGSTAYHCPFCGVMHLQGDNHRDGCEAVPLINAVAKLKG